MMQMAWLMARLGIVAAAVMVMSNRAKEVAAETTSSRLQVQIPTTLFKDGGYPHQEALFGIPLYGGSIAESLYYPGVTPDEKGEPTLKAFQLCDDTSAAQVSVPDSSPFVLLVDRGDCTFVSKVRRAQHLGASAVIIADNKCLCSEKTAGTCVAAECEPVEPIMADDGSGADITIPSFLMKKPDAGLIIQQFMAKQKVIVELAWAMPAPDNRVEWSLWTSALDPTGLAFKRDFKDVVLAMGQHQYFEPHYVIFDGSQYGCTSPDHKCGTLCTNAGRYCMTSPDANNPLSGKDIVLESLRQKCVWQTYGGAGAPTVDQGIGEKWWSYVYSFASTCGTDKFTDEACISGVMKQLGIDKASIDSCMAASGGTATDVTNSILQEEINDKATKSIVITPTVYVNNVVERGGITPLTVLGTICAGFEADSKPATCSCARESSVNGLKACIASPDNQGGSVISKGVSIGAVMGIVVLVIIGMLAAGFVYYKHTQSQMRDQVRGILAEYMPLEDLDNPNSNARVGLMSGINDDEERNGRGNNVYVAPKEHELM